MLKRLGILFGLTICIALTACGGDDDSTPATGKSIPPAVKALIEGAPSALDIVSFVGTVDGTDAYIAVVDDSGTAKAYVCDGATTAKWLAGTATVSSVEASSDTAQLNAVRVGDELDGTVTLAGVARHFHAARQDFPADLYEQIAPAGDELWRAGWIVLDDGSQRGATTKGTTVAQTSNVDPTNLSGDPEGDGASVGGAVPAQPVPFKTGKQTKVPTPPPSLAVRCGGLEIRYDTGIGVVNSDTASDAAKQVAGNAAADAFRTALGLGCQWAKDLATAGGLSPT